MKFSYKKGQENLGVSAMPAIVLTLVLIGFYLSFGLLITNDMGVTTYILNSATTVNQSFTPLVNISQQINGVGYNPTGFSALVVTNFSNDYHLKTSSYTFDGAGIFTLTNSTFNNTKLNITFSNSYSVATSATNATINTEKALNTFSSRLPLLALVVFFAVILSVIAILASTGKIQV